MAKVILVVEDDPIIRLSAVEMIEAAGLAARWAMNASDAMALFEGGTRVDVLFTDIDMPGEFDGLQLAGLVRSGWPTTHIVATSGKAGVSSDLLPHPALFFKKPYDQALLVEAIRKLD